MDPLDDDKPRGASNEPRATSPAKNRFRGRFAFMAFFAFVVTLAVAAAVWLLVTANIDAAGVP